MKRNKNTNFNTLPNDENDLKKKVINIESCESCNKKFFINLSFVKKGLIILSLSLILFNQLKVKKDYKSNISINMVQDDLSYFAQYSLGKVYICNSEDFYLYQEILEENDILVIDKRDSENPDMCIYNSFKICNPKIIEEVLLILREYENMYPSSWNRTLDSMFNEWLVHNLFYNFNLRTDSTAHVDLDNEDEKLYEGLLLEKLFK